MAFVVALSTPQAMAFFFLRPLRLRVLSENPQPQQTIISIMDSNFIDYVKIHCRSGKGGKGSMHLRHVKYQPNGGPDGGDGGHGGSVILRGNHNYWTLLHLKYQRHIFAENGGNGGRDKCHGTDGKDVYIDVPCGTVVYDADTGKYVCDVTYDGQEVVLLKGGRGGLGNWQFRTATRQAPRFAQPGEPMQEMTIILELKLLADVGLVGFPNAGKSTLLSALSSARPKIANYPFTTLEPSLGIVSYRDNKSFVMADIPGIIEGASEGKGLGLRFLRHIERNSLLLFMVPGDTDDIKHDYEVLLNELRKFNPEMLDKQRVLAVTKCDLLDEELIGMLKEDLPSELPVVFISSVSGYGLDELKDVLWEHLNSESNKLQEITAEDTLVHRDKDLEQFKAEQHSEGVDDDDVEYIDGEELDDITDLEDYDEVEPE
jgi:GTP-binding protein